MTDADEIIVLSPDDVEDDYSEVREDEEEAAPRKQRWPLWIGAAFVLGLIVASIGSWFINPSPFDPEPLETRLAALEAELDRVKSDLQTLENQPEPVIPTVDLSPLERRIVDLEARPTVDPLNEEIVSRMEALQAEGFKLPEIPEFPDMSALEAQIAALEVRIQTLEDRPLPVIVDPIPVIEVTIDPAALPSFPATALRQGADELSGSGFFRRTLSRHIRLKGDTSPHVLIDGIEKDMAAGRAEAAVTKFDQLPENLQSLARGWRADMEGILP